MLHEINGSELLLDSKNKRVVTFSSDGQTVSACGGELGSMVLVDYRMAGGGDHLDLVQDHSSYHRQSLIDNNGVTMNPYTKLDVIPSSCQETILTSDTSSCDGTKS